MRSRYGLRTPVYRHKANPYQSLIDIAKEQRANPTTHLVVTDRILMGVFLDEKLPYVRVRVCFTNFGLNEVSISQPEGYPYFGNNRSPYELKDTGERYNVPPGNTATSFDFNIQIPHELLEEIRQEAKLPSGEIRSISLRSVTAQVQAKTEGAPVAKWNFGRGREVFRPNR